jgi:hypothetical protein
VGVGECEIGRSALLQRLRDSGCGPVPLPLDHDSLLHWVTGSADVHMSDALAFKVFQVPPPCLFRSGCRPAVLVACLLDECELMCGWDAGQLGVSLADICGHVMLRIWAGIAVHCVHSMVFCPTVTTLCAPCIQQRETVHRFRSRTSSKQMWGRGPGSSGQKLYRRASAAPPHTARRRC